MGIEIIIAFIQQSIRLSFTLLLGSTGEIITEKSGNLNLGTPGIMACGAISGIIGAFFYTKSGLPFNPFISILLTFICCFLGSLIASLIY